MAFGMKYVLALTIIFFTNVHEAVNIPKKDEDILQEIYKMVYNMQEIMQRENRLREITQLLQVDSSLEKIEKKVSDLAQHLESDGRQVAVPSARSNDGQEQVVNRLRSLEITVESLQGSMMSKVEGSLKKLQDLEAFTGRLKDDLDTKLRKMMNIVTSVHEMNKELKNEVQGKKESRSTGGVAGQEEKANRDGGPVLDSNAVAFLTESLDMLEQKVQEQMSVLGVQVHTELNTLSATAASVLGQCEATATELRHLQERCPGTNVREVEDLFPETNYNPDYSRTRTVVPESRKTEAGFWKESLDRMMVNLSRSQREIQEELQKGMKGMERKLQDINDAKATQKNCNPTNPDIQQALQPSSHSGRRFDSSDSPSSNKNCVSTSHIIMPTSCAELKKGGATCDGTYIIYPQGVKALKVYCDMTSRGGGWTVIMRRGDFGPKHISFEQDWNSYKDGFGDLEGEFWLGNHNIHLLSAQDTVALAIDVEAFNGDTMNLTYDSFFISNESESFALWIGKYIGDPNHRSHGNAMYIHHRHPFSTFDKPSSTRENCALKFQGGWWFGTRSPQLPHTCRNDVFLTGKYYKPTDSRAAEHGLQWRSWRRSAPLKSVVMKIRS